MNVRNGLGLQLLTNWRTLLNLCKVSEGTDLTEVINGYKRFGLPNCGGKIEGRHISIIALSAYHVDYMKRFFC